MLNQETKQRIDSARDILVGKVPDPKAQVEQITTALIYKFMYDMDVEAEELGGEPQFFTNEYEKYAWNKLLDSTLGGFDRLNLYTEALLKMPLNPNLPQLFRNILKDAFLPYRDPETLNLFLKEINSFTYDHSEKLGDAFEYLLSVLGSQGDAGQFRTPRHIIDFIVQAVDPKKEDTVLDPACGTAGFLISAYKHILRANTQKRLGDQLTPEEKKKLMNHFTGYDISPEMVRLSLVNMYLHSFPNPNVYEYDTLTSEERWDETFDVIIANPPFMSPKGGIRPHKRFSMQSSRSEVLFVDYIVEHLNNHGRAGVIVPEGIIFQSGTAYKALRKTLVEKYVYAVVSLPSGIFQPYSGVKTSILLMDKQLAKRADTILFIKVDNDGFDLGAQRRAIEKNDLTQALLLLQGYKYALQENTNPHEVSGLEENSRMAFVTDKAKIAKNGDYNLSGERYRESVITLNQEWPMVELGDVCETTSGGTPLKSRNEYYENGNIPWLKSGEVAQGFIYESEEKITEEGLNNSSAKIFPVNTVLVAMYGATAGQVGLLKFEATTNQAICGILPSDKFVPEFLYWILKSQREFLVALSGGGAQPNISQNIIRKLTIPLPPLHVQQEIVTVLDNYRKIIDGAKQVVENYTPQINVSLDYDMIELGEICQQIQYGISLPMNRDGKGYKIFRMQEVKDGMFFDNGNMKFVDISASEYEKYKLNKDDILFNRTNSYELVGRTGIFKLAGDYCFASYLIRMVVNKAIALPDYINFFMNTQDFQTNIKSRATRAIGQANINAKSLAEYKIPLPPLDVQVEIVKQLEAEQRLVNANKELIMIFEQKVKDKIAKIW